MSRAQNARGGPGVPIAKLCRLERPLVVDEVGHLPFERRAANLLFALVSRRYERGSVIVTSSSSFEQCGEILGDALKGKSYRLRERGAAPRRPGSAATAAPPERGSCQ